MGSNADDDTEAEHVLFMISGTINLAFDGDNQSLSAGIMLICQLALLVVAE